MHDSRFRTWSLRVEQARMCHTNDRQLYATDGYQRRGSSTFPSHGGCQRHHPISYASKHSASGCDCLHKVAERITVRDAWRNPSKAGAHTSSAPFAFLRTTTVAVTVSVVATVVLAAVNSAVVAAPERFWSLLDSGGTGQGRIPNPSIRDHEWSLHRSHPESDSPSVARAGPRTFRADALAGYARPHRGAA